MKRRFIGASEGSSVFLVGVCLSGILVSIASLFFKNGDGQFGGMPNSSWVGYALTQAGLIVAAFGYFGIRKLDIPYLMRIKKAALALATFVCAAYCNRDDSRFSPARKRLERVS